MLDFLNPYKPYYRKNFLLAYPVVISQLGQMAPLVADSLMVGKLGTVPLAASALGNSVLGIFMVSGIGFSQGITPIIAQENGKNNKSICGEYLENGIFINSILGILLFGIVCLITFNLHWLDQPIAVASQAKSYLLVIGASILPLMIFQTFRQFAEGLGYTKQAMILSISGNVMNILLNFLLIYGWFGFPALGLLGAGLGTFISRIFMALGMGFFVLKSSLFKPYILSFKLSKTDGQKILHMSSLGFPIAMQYFFEVGAFSGATIMMGWMGATEQAAHQIALNLAALTYMGATGIAAAATIRSGNAFGKKDFRELRMSAISSYHLVLAYMTFTALIFLSFNHFLPLLYIHDPAVVSIAAQLMIIAAFFQLSDGFQTVGAGILRGLSDVKIPTFVTLFAYWIFALPLGYLLGFVLHFGPIGIWIALALALTAVAILLFYRFNKLSKKLQLEI